MRRRHRHQIAPAPRPSDGDAELEQSLTSTRGWHHRCAVEQSWRNGEAMLQPRDYRIGEPSRPTIRRIGAKTGGSRGEVFRKPRRWPGCGSPMVRSIGSTPFGA